MKTFLFLLLGLFLAPGLMRGEGTAAFNEPDKQNDYNKIVVHFFKFVKAERYTDAAHVMIDTNPDDAYSVEKHEAIAAPLEKITEKFGAFKEFKPLVSKTLGDSIGYIYGVGFYEKSPIRFEFFFYKDGAHWRMLHIDFNVNFIDEIREMAGVHIQDPPAYAPPPVSPPLMKLAPGTGLPPSPTEPSAPSTPPSASKP